MSNFTTKVDFLRQIKNFTGLTATGSWNLTGNTITSSDFIGSLNDQPIKIKVNNTDKINVDNEGLIIGNNSINEVGVTNTLSIRNGIKPTSGNTDSVLLFADDIEGTNSSGLVIISEDNYIHKFGNKVIFNSGNGLIESSTLLSVDGGLSLSISATTDNTVNFTNDLYTLLCDTSLNNITVNLPSLSNYRGKIIVIKKVSQSNHVKIQPSIFEDIDGYENMFLLNNNDYIILQSPGNIGGFTGWKSISKKYSNLLFTQTGNSSTVSGTTVETTIIDGGIGTLVIPADFFKVGQIYTAKLSGMLSAANSQTLTIRLKSGSVTLGSDTITFPNISNRPWQCYIDFIIRETGGVGVASIKTNGLFSFHNFASDVLGGGFDTTNNSTFNTTISNTLDFTVQWGSNNSSNSIYSTNFYLELKNQF